MEYGFNVLTAKFGASWENRCPEKNLWVPSPVAINEQENEEWSGTPGAQNSWLSCAPSLPTPPRILISEIMYNPVDEVAMEEVHEYVEFYNPGEAPADISNFRFSSAGFVTYTFPENTVIPGNSYFILAKEVASFRQEYYELSDTIPVFGDFYGELNNKGDTIVLLDDNNQVVDWLVFNDKFPWPVSADNFGASQRFTPHINQSDYTFTGVSLSRISFDVASDNISNWIDDLANPGGPPRSTTVQPIVVAISLSPPANAIYNTSDVTIFVNFSFGVSGIPVLVYHAWDPIARQYIGVQSEVPMTRIDESSFSVVLPPQETGTIVNYRVSGSGIETSPREGDPFEWHKYHVTSADVQTTAKFYQLYLNPDSWAQLWYNIRDGRNFPTDLGPECGINPLWNKGQNATIVYNGQVCDAFVRFQGNWGGRREGDNITYWPFPGPSFFPGNGSEPFRVLNFRVDLPKFCTFDGESIILFHKIDRDDGSCTHFSTGVLFEVMALANQISPDVDYVRLHVNGGYFRYALKVEMPDGSDVTERYFNIQKERCPDRKHEKEAWLYKNIGCWCNSGAISMGDYRIIPDGCGYNTFQRFSATFELETLRKQSNGSEAIMNLAIGINASLESNSTAIARQYLSDNFDVNYMLTHFAIMSFASSEDDNRHNHLLVRRRSDKKFIMLAWDFDFLFVDAASRTVFFGGEPDPKDDPDDYSRLKKIFFWAYREEYLARLQWLNKKIVTSSTMSTLTKYIAKQKWQESERQQCITPYYASNEMDSCYAESEQFIPARKAFLENLDSTYDPDTYTVDLCLDSPRVQPVYSAYKSRPGKSVSPSITNAATGTTYLISWYPSNPNGNVVTLYEVFYRSSASADPTLIYNGTQLATNWTSPTVLKETTYSFTVRAKNSAGYGTFSDSTQISASLSKLAEVGKVGSAPFWYYLVGVIGIVLLIVAIIVIVTVVKNKGNLESYNKMKEPITG
jgi:hypothetical protein